MNHYEALDIPQDADASAIRRAYRKKAKEAHPDREGGDTSRMVAINRAYETLSDPERRARYDATGEDQPAPSLDSRAIEVIMQLVMNLIERHPESHDLIASARSEIRTNQANFKTQQAAWRQKIRELEKRRKHIKHRGEGRNFLDDLLAHRIGEITAQIVALDENLALGDRALELMKAYEWKGPKEQGDIYEHARAYVLDLGLSQMRNLYGG